jgi:hypothetical protein
MAGSKTYALSFTSGALLLAEANVTVPVYLRERDWGRTRAALERDNLLQSRTVATGQRRAREVIQRLAVMTDLELEMLDAATSSERGHLLWVAACRRYDLIGEFAEEVVRERFLTLAETLTHADFDAFLLAKAIWHDEIDQLKDTTRRKLRANVFRMLTEAGLLSEQGGIVPVLVSERVVALLDQQAPSDLRFFPVRGPGGGSGA